jgi:hypothetical protein
MATTKPPLPPPPPAAESPDAAATTTTVLEDRRPLTRAQVEALNETWRDVVLADDEDAKALTRRIVARLRRASHEELHPDCPRVVVDVPQLPTGHFVLLNGKPYIGRMEMWRCEAQTVLGLVHTAREVEAARLRDDGRTVDLDREGLAARARAIQSA